MKTFGEWKAHRESRKTIMDRLRSGDALHNEAADMIAELRAEVRSLEKEANEEPRNAYSQGKQDGYDEARRDARYDD